MTTSRALLIDLWSAGHDRLLRRLAGLADEEFHWEPVAGCWGLRPDPDAPGGWALDYPFPPPEPAPVTTLAWRLVHLASGNLIRWEHAVGPARRTFLELAVPSTAAAAVEFWVDSAAPVGQWLAAATEADLLRPGRTVFGEDITAGETARILLDEQTHHGAEIGLLRDLYLRRRELRSGPAGVAADRSGS